MASWMALMMIVAVSARGQSGHLSLLDDRNFPPLGVSLDREPAGFWDRFELAFDQRVDEAYVNRLHPLKIIGWNFSRPDDSSRWLLDRINRSAQSTLAKSVQFSLRDALVGLPLMNWLEMKQDAFSELIVDTVDAVEEETVSPLDPLYRPTERLWWQSLAGKRMLRYGLRPFRTDPYAFVSLRVQDADRLLLLGHVRYYYDNLADHRFELAVSLPLMHGFTLDAGTACQFGPSADEKKVVLKLFKPLKHGGIVHVGLEVPSRPTCFAGISIPM